ncbi:MAG: hypothetical protein RBR53_04005 [Desulforegulaceae bacterium]|nr:hypothetical protein [Desulforegulaceae bacterium]
MDKIKIRDLMRPIEAFPVISSDASFMDGVVTLENVDEQFKSGKTPERILLVHDKNGKVIGKLSPMDIVQGLEPNYDYIDRVKSGQYGKMIRSWLLAMKNQLQLWHKPFEELCERANKIKIYDFIKMPKSDQMVMIDDSIDVAFHLFVLSRHGSLFVKEGENIVGLILFSDIYKKIRESIKTCKI